VGQEIVVLDGKALRRALASDQSVKYVVSDRASIAVGWWTCRRVWIVALKLSATECNPRRIL
jgi:hypothetical protein